MRSLNFLLGTGREALTREQMRTVAGGRLIDDGDKCASGKMKCCDNTYCTGEAADNGSNICTAGYTKVCA